jgi:hypothetical protein
MSSTVPTLAVPAPAPTTPPVKYTLAPASTPTGLQIFSLKAFTMPSQKYKWDQTTNTSSPLQGLSVLEESVLTTLDPGEASFEGVLNPADPGFIAVQAAYVSGLPQSFQVQLPPIAGQATTGNVYEFTAWVSENPLPMSIDAGKAITFKLSLKLNSFVTVLTGS